jgi:hypothetical protein
MRRSYEDSLAELRGCVEILGDPQPRVTRPPRHDDEDLGPSIFRTLVEDVALEDLTLPGLYVGRSELKRVSFRGSDLHLSSLNWSDIRDCDFSASDLSGADLRACEFVRCTFAGGDLSSADLRGSGFHGCVFRGRSDARYRAAPPSEASRAVCNGLGSAWLAALGNPAFRRHVVAGGPATWRGLGRGEGAVEQQDETDERRRGREANRRAFARPTRGVLGRRSRLILVLAGRRRSLGGS